MTVAIVTGASRGIGRAIALQLAADGMDVVVNDIDKQIPDLESLVNEIEAKGLASHMTFAGRRSKYIVADVSKENEVQHLVKATVDEFSELNVMVANAGIIVPKKLLEVSLAEWEQVQAVNATGTFLCYREAARQMVAQGKGGKILGACSIAGHRPSGNALAYSTSKWTVRGLTQAAALDLAEYDINVNAYCPGPVDTAVSSIQPVTLAHPKLEADLLLLQMWGKIDASVAERDGVAQGTVFQKSIQARSALKRASTPEDIANLVAFLASSKARNITGQSVICDGGITFA
ncbi:hypothetical protein BJY01DRAFT_254432 [Aspergillus pseudoustus]|uniref:Acetoin reductase family protein n=1 Tax=Aspergillus pseudoustus TaxID=1810923 RepID=A0ABR4IW23_9EURO